MSENQVKILADSINPHGCRLTTFLLRFPRIVLAEYNTHKMICKNTSSSRAIKFEKMVESVEGDPFIPFAFQKHHAGMQGQEYLSGWQEQEARVKWIDARNAAVDKAKQLYQMGVTKQICNRLLEPFSWVTMVSSATEWQNFFALRAHKDAEIHLQDLAYKMLEAYNANQPTKLEPGEWHIPFGDKIDENKLSKLTDPRGENGSWELALFEGAKKKIAIARIARTSYNNFEGKDDYEADIKLCDRLMGSTPKHLSPAEAVAQCMDDDKFIGPFQGWKQYRKFFTDENLTDERVKDYG